MDVTAVCHDEFPEVLVWLIFDVWGKETSAMLTARASATSLGIQERSTSAAH